METDFITTLVVNHEKLVNTFKPCWEGEGGDVKVQMKCFFVAEFERAAKIRKICDVMRWTC